MRADTIGGTGGYVRKYSKLEKKGKSLGGYLFSQVLMHLFTKSEGGHDEDFTEGYVKKYNKLEKKGKSLGDYLYYQVLMHLFTKSKGRHKGGFSISRMLCQEVQQARKKR